MELADRAWLAGIIDGEGCIGIYETTHRYKGKTYMWFRPAITIGMTDEWVIKKIQNICGVGKINIRPIRETNRMARECYVFTTQKWNDCEKIISLVIDYLVLKKQQALVMYWACKSVKTLEDNRSSCRDIKNKGYISKLCNLIQKLNQRQYSDFQMMR